MPRNRLHGVSIPGPNTPGECGNQEENIMSISITTFLRNVLNIDALVSGAAALAMIVGAPLIAPLTSLPSGLLAGAGLVLVPWVVVLVMLARRQTLSRLVMIDVVAVNALWVAASFGLLVSGYITPNWLGVAFIAAQAITVAVLADLQFIGLRRAQAVAA